MGGYRFLSGVFVPWSVFDEELFLESWGCLEGTKLGPCSPLVLILVHTCFVVGSAVVDWLAMAIELLAGV